MTALHLSRRTLLGSLGAGLLMSASRGAMAAQTLDALKKAGEIKIGCEAAYVPFTYRDSSGKIVGFDVDFATRMFEPIGVKPAFMDAQWSGIIPALQAGRFDAVPTMSYTKERLERVLFSIPYADASQALLIRASDKDKIKSIGDMSGRVLGNKLGSAGETLQPKLDAQIKAERGAGFKDIKIYDDHPAAYLALAQGTVDGVLNTVPTLSVVLRDKPGVYAMIQKVGFDNWHGYAFRKEDTELAEFLNGRITAMKANGEIAALQDKWFGFHMDLADKIPSFS
jgi:polar amino acid transport system substrate-binding protein